MGAAHLPDLVSNSNIPRIHQPNWTVIEQYSTESQKHFLEEAP